MSPWFHPNFPSETLLQWTWSNHHKSCQSLSLSEGIFPSSFKQVLVQPLLKKPSLSTDDLNNFRLISNLNFISKILEKVVASRLQSHLSSNSLSSSFQSAYRIFHSTETTFLKIHNDLILAMDRGEVTSLILLDLSAAFDTVDHSILLTRLQNWFGLDGLSLNWFTSYLSSRSQAVSINDSISAFSTLSCGVPPRFRTWPTPFYSLYHSSWLGDLKKFPQIPFVRWWHPAVHLFHPYKFCFISWNTYPHFHWHSFLDELEQTAPQSIYNWISSYWHKTTTSQIFWSYKLISQQWYHPSQFLCSQSWLHLWLWHVFLWTNQLSVQILSFSHPRHPSNPSSSSSFCSHSPCKFTCLQQTWLLQFHIRDIRRIRHLLPLSAATALANSLVSSKLDYCNSLYSGISQANLNKLQHIQNSLARVITNTSKYQHITPTLKKLHWFPIKQRIDYKLCLLTNKTLTNQQPTYLYNSLSFPSHSVSTRSSDSLVLSIPYVRSSLGKRAFSVIGPRLWNSLPPDTRNSSFLPIFRSRLKTHLFKIAFPP